MSEENLPVLRKVAGKAQKLSVSFERDERPAEAFDSPDAENIIALNGLKSELCICAFPKEDPGQ